MSDYEDKTPTRGRGSRPPALPRTFEELQAASIEVATELRIFKRETRGSLNAGSATMAKLTQGVEDAKRAAAEAVAIATTPRKVPPWLVTVTLTLGLAAAGALWRLARYPDERTFARSQEAAAARDHALDERLRQLELARVKLESRIEAVAALPPAPVPVIAAPPADPLGRTTPRRRR